MVIWQKWRAMKVMESRERSIFGQSEFSYVKGQLLLSLLRVRYRMFTRTKHHGYLQNKYVEKNYALAKPNKAKQKSIITSMCQYKQKQTKKNAKHTITLHLLMILYIAPITNTQTFKLQNDCRSAIFRFGFG